MKAQQLLGLSLGFFLFLETVSSASDGNYWRYEKHGNNRNNRNNRNTTSSKTQSGTQSWSSYFFGPSSKKANENLGIELVEIKKKNSDQPISQDLSPNSVSSSGGENEVANKQSTDGSRLEQTDNGEANHLLGMKEAADGNSDSRLSSEKGRAGEGDEVIDINNTIDGNDDQSTEIDSGSVSEPVHNINSVCDTQGSVVEEGSSSVISASSSATNTASSSRRGTIQAASSAGYWNNASSPSQGASPAASATGSGECSSFSLILDRVDVLPAEEASQAVSSIAAKEEVGSSTEADEEVAASSENNPEGGVSASAGAVSPNVGGEGDLNTTIPSSSSSSPTDPDGANTGKGTSSVPPVSVTPPIPTVLLEAKEMRPRWMNFSTSLVLIVSVVCVAGVAFFVFKADDGASGVEL